MVMVATSWIRLYAHPLRIPARCVGLVWLTVLFTLPVAGPIRAGGTPGLVLGIVLMPLAAYAWHRCAKVLWRLTNIGLFVSATGIKVRNPTEQVVSWGEADGIETKPWGMFEGMLTQYNVMWIVRRDGSAVSTRVYQGRPGTLVGRRKYKRITEAVEGMIQDPSQRPSGGPDSGN